MKRFSLLVGAGMLVMMGAGCNPFQAAQERAQQAIGEKIGEQIIERASGGKVDVDVSGGGLNIRDNESGNTVNLGGANGTQIPSNFPSFVGRYPNGTPGAVSVSADGKTGALYIGTSDPMDRVVAWVESTYAGWTRESMTDLGGAGRIYSFMKDGTRVSVAVSASQDASQPGATVITNFAPAQ